MKHASEWNEEYLLNLPAYEPNHIEFKGKKSLDLTVTGANPDKVKNTLSTALSAFANSGGGMIVYGVKDPEPEKPLLIDDGGIPLSIKSRQSTKEWLEDVIPHLTDLPLSDFHVYPIERKTDDSQIAEGHAVFIIEVPNSERAPHQANDNKYYIRAGGKSQPIGHQLVMDIMGRRQHPIIELQLYIQSNLDFVGESHWLEGLEDEKSKNRHANLYATLKNAGYVYAQYVNCFIYIPVLPNSAENISSSIKTIDGRRYFVLTKENTSRDLIQKVERQGVVGILQGTEYGPSWFKPILPSLELSWEVPFPNNINPYKGNHKLLWEVYADNAPVNKGEIEIKNIRLLSRDGTLMNGS